MGVIFPKFWSNYPHCTPIKPQNFDLWVNPLSHKGDTTTLNCPSSTCFVYEMCCESSHISKEPRFLCNIPSACLKQQKTTKGRKLERYLTYSDNYRILLFDYHFQLQYSSIFTKCLSASPCVCCRWITTIGVKIYTIFVQVYTIPVQMYTIAMKIYTIDIRLFTITVQMYYIALQMYTLAIHVSTITIQKMYIITVKKSYSWTDKQYHCLDVHYWHTCLC